jgi:predicted small secreted protein
MKKILIVAPALFSMLLSACAGTGLSTEAGGSKAVANTDFFQRWVHSYEEQNGQKTPNIFRPAGSREFPPSRFRMEFGFDPSGQCNYKYLSPVDAHELRNCVYTKIDNKVYLYDDGGKALNHLAFTIVSLNKAELKMVYGVKSPVKADAKASATSNAKPQ